MKNLTKCNILKTFPLKNNGKFADLDLEKQCPWSLALASTISVPGLESICPPKVDPWPGIFFETLALASKAVPSAPPLILT